MARCRTLILSHPSLAALLLAIALVVKALVPAGYMVSASRTITVEICADSLGQRISKQITIASNDPAHQAEQAKAAMAKKPCSFAGHGASWLPAADALLLAAALAFILALGFAPVSLPRLIRASWITPPANAPPVLA